MRRKARSIVMLIVLCLLIQGVFATANAAGETTADYDNIVSIMTGLGVMDSNDKDYEADRELTRGEVAAMAIRALNCNSAAQGQLESGFFYDVTEGTPYARYINLAHSMNVVSGDGEGYFRPADPITYLELSKILVCMTGRDVVAKNSGGYPVGYSSVAVSNGIFKKVDVSLEQNAKRGPAAQMFYNAMNVVLLETVYSNGEDMYEESETKETLMSKLIALKEKYGRVTGNSRTTLSNNSKTKIGYVEITVDNTPVLFRVGDTNAEELLGQEVEFYATADNHDEITLVAAVPRTGRNQLLTISGKDITGINNGKLEYEVTYEDGRIKEEKASIGTDPVYLYNGVYVTPQRAQELGVIPENGFITLLDSNNDDVYELLSIQKFVNLEVSAPGEEAGEIKLYFKPGKYPVGETVLSSSGSKLQSKVYLDGKLLQEEEYLTIPTGSICSLAESDDKEYREVRISSSTVSGILQEISDDNSTISYRVDGIVYDVAKEFDKNVDIGTQYQFALSYDNKIVAFSQNSRRENYAYLIDIGAKSGIQSTVEVKIMDASGEQKILQLKDRVRINGTSIQASDAVAKVTKERVVRYELDTNGQISSLETALDHSAESDYNQYDEDTFTLDVKETLYYKNSTPATLGNNTKNIELKLRDDVIVFDVSDDDEEEWGVFDNSSFENDERYIIEAYDNDKFKSPRVLVNKGCINAEVNSKVLWTAPALLVEKITHVVDEEGNSVYKITGLENGQQVERFTRDLSLKDEDGNYAIEKLARGSVIQCRYNYDEKLKSFRILHDFNDGKMNSKTWSGSENDIKLFTIYAMAAEAEEQILTTTMDSGSTTRAFATGKANYYIFDTKTQEAKLASYDKIKPYSSFGVDASKVFLRISKNDTYDVIIYQ